MQQRRTGHPGRRAALVVLTSIVLGILLLQNAVFVVKTVIVDGVQRYTPEQVYALTGIKRGQSIFSLDKQVIATNLSSDHFLELAGMEIRYPDTVVLQVRERTPRAVVSSLGVLAMLDDGGRVLSTTNKLDTDVAIPFIMGVRVPTLTIGMPLSCEPKQLEAIIAIMDELTLQGVTGTIDQINVADLENLHLIMASGMKVELGDVHDLEQKVGMMRATLSALQAEGFYAGELDVSSATVADFIANLEVEVDYRIDPTAVPNELVGR